MRPSVLLVGRRDQEIRYVVEPAYRAIAIEHRLEIPLQQARGGAHCDDRLVNQLPEREVLLVDVEERLDLRQAKDIRGPFTDVVEMDEPNIEPEPGLPPGARRVELQTQ